MADIAIYPVKLAETDQTYNVRMQCDESINVMLATSIQIVEDIPSNYGLITWNGSYLTVS